MLRNNLNWIFLLLIGTSIALTSCEGDGLFNDCPKGDIETRTLDVTGFTGVELDIAGDVEITQGSEFSVVAEGHQGILDLLKLEVENDVWVIDLEENCNGNYELTIRITMPAIQSLKIDGSGNIRGQNTFDGADIDLDIDGSGDINLDLNATQVVAEIDGSGNIILEGSSDTFELEIDGSGDFGNFDFEANHATIKIDGSGDARITAIDALKVTINGSGDVRYKGNPTLDVKINGSGDVSDAN